MPSLERLIAEVEPAVLTDELIRDCIVVSGHPELAEEKRRTLPLGQVEAAALSFRSLARIDNLAGLDRLTKLQLDNNQICRIENLGHLTTLTWLDLSFNRISAIEGLGALTRLQDLSLFGNRVAAIEGLDALTELNALSLGCNAIERLDAVRCLTRFARLQLLNLSGNPAASDPDYRPYTLSQLPQLVYLDYRRVQPAERAAAAESHQDAVAELREATETAAAERAAAADRAAHAAAMAEANLQGVEHLLEHMAACDPEWAKLSCVPGLLEPWNDVRDKWQVATDEFKLIILDGASRKKAETAAYKAALAAALREREQEGRSLLAAFERAKKHVLRAAAQRPEDAEGQVLSAKVKLMALQETLMALEVDAAETVQELASEHDRCYGEMAEAAKLHYNTYFTQVRDLLTGFFSALAASAPSFLDHYSGAASDGAELEALPEEVQAMLGDKDTLAGALQASHEARASALDVLEDELVANEVGAANRLADDSAAWQEQRHRDRTAEILAYMERCVEELEQAAADADEAAAGGGPGEP